MKKEDGFPGQISFFIPGQSIGFIFPEINQASIRGWSASP